MLLMIKPVHGFDYERGVKSIKDIFKINQAIVKSTIKEMIDRQIAELANQN